MQKSQFAAATSYPVRLSFLSYTTLLFDGIFQVPCAFAKKQTRLRNQFVFW